VERLLPLPVVEPGQRYERPSYAIDHVIFPRPKEVISPKVPKPLPHPFPDIKARTKTFRTPEEEEFFQIIEPDPYRIKYKFGL
jgi:hypothetical protein